MNGGLYERNLRPMYKAAAAFARSFALDKLNQIGK